MSLKWAAAWFGLIGGIITSDPRAIHLVIFHPPLRPSLLERAVGLAQRAATRDLLARAAAVGFQRVIIAGAEAEFAAAAQASGMEIALEADADPNFHFGQRLGEIVAHHQLDRFIYIGGGAAPLLGGDELLNIAAAISGEQTTAIANNIYSADIVALGPHAAAALQRIDPPELDNDLAWRLRYQAGVPTTALPPALGLNFDIDTPTDLATLALAVAHHSGAAIGPHLRAVLDDYRASELAARSLTALQAAFAAMLRRDGETLFCGRIGATVWRQLELALPGQTRLLGEERGMRASGREAAGAVRSLLGFLVQRAGAGQAIADLGQLAQAAFIDTRVLFNHLHLDLTAADRFASDALQWEQIADPIAREFTAAAAASPVPFVLGGHSLVAGGLSLLATLVQELRQAN